MLCLAWEVNKLWPKMPIILAPNGGRPRSKRSKNCMPCDEVRWLLTVSAEVAVFVARRTANEQKQTLRQVLLQANGEQTNRSFIKRRKCSIQQQQQSTATTAACARRIGECLSGEWNIHSTSKAHANERITFGSRLSSTLSLGSVACSQRIRESRLPERLSVCARDRFLSCLAVSAHGGGGGGIYGPPIHWLTWLTCQQPPPCGALCHCTLDPFRVLLVWMSFPLPANGHCARELVVQSPNVWMKAPLQRLR